MPPASIRIVRHTAAALRQPAGEASWRCRDAHLRSWGPSCSSGERGLLALLLAASLAGCVMLPGEQPASRPAPLQVDRYTLPPPGEAVVGGLQATVTRREDTLPDLARQFDLGFDEIAAANPGVDAWVPGEGTRVLLPTRHILPRAPRRGLVLNLAAMRLYYYPPNAEQVVTHPIGIGREGWATPRGRTRVVAKQASPAWHVPASVRAEHAREGDPLPAVVPPGPDNPLGSHALRLGIPAYLIHGTNKPYGVGMRVSHGCVRLYPEDISALYAQVPVGARVTIVDQPYLAGWRDGELYLEAHAPLHERQRKDRAAVERLLRRAAGKRSADVDWERAREIVHARRGVPLPVLRGAPGTDQVLAQVPTVRHLSAAPAPKSGAGAWYIQLGEYADAETARRMGTVASHLGLAVRIQTRPVAGGYRVYAGPYAELALAVKAERRLGRELEVSTAVLPAEDLPSGREPAWWRRWQWWRWSGAEQSP